MKNLDVKKTIKILNEILEYELAGVVKYTHFALMVAGPNRIILDRFFKAQATESLEHAQQSGELLTGLGGHPSQKIPKIDETNQHSVQNLLSESLIHEEKAISLYNKLLGYRVRTHARGGGGLLVRRVRVAVKELVLDWCGFGKGFLFYLGS